MTGGSVEEAFWLASTLVDAAKEQVGGGGG